MPMLSAVPPALRRVIAIDIPQSEEEQHDWVKLLTAGGSGALAYSTVVATGLIGTPIAIGGLTLALFEWFKRTKARGPLPHNVLRVSLKDLDPLIQFPPGYPFPGAVLALNPVRPNVYLPMNDFHRVTLREKAGELVKLLGGLRATTATVSVERGTARSGEVGFSALIPVDVPVRVAAGGGSETKVSTGLVYQLVFDYKGKPRIPEGLQWVKHEPEWDSLAVNRLEHGLRDFQCVLRYADSFGINAELAGEIEKAGFSLGGKFERFEEEHWVFTGSFAKRPLLGW